MIDIVTMLVNKFFRSCFLSDLFRAAWAARDWADVLHVTRAQAGAGVNSLKCPHCVVSALTASTIQIQTRVRVPHVSSSGSRSTCRWSIHRSLWQHMSWLAFDTEKAELQIKLILLFTELDLIEYLRNVLCLYNQHKIIQIYDQDLLHAKWTTNEQCCFCINVGDILLWYVMPSLM